MYTYKHFNNRKKSLAGSNARWSREDWSRRNQLFQQKEVVNRWKV